VIPAQGWKKTFQGLTLIGWTLVSLLKRKGEAGVSWSTFRALHRSFMILRWVRQSKLLSCYTQIARTSLSLKALWQRNSEEQLDNFQTKLVESRQETKDLFGFTQCFRKLFFLLLHLCLRQQCFRKRSPELLLMFFMCLKWQSWNLASWIFALAGGIFKRFSTSGTIVTTKCAICLAACGPTESCRMTGYHAHSSICTLNW